MPSQPVHGDDSTDAFARLYENTLRPAIPGVFAEKSRNALRTALDAIVVFIAALALFSLLLPSAFARPGSSERNWFSMSLFAAALAVLSWRWLSIRRRGSSGRAFRTRILAPIAGSVASGLSYAPDRHISPEDFAQSLLFDPLRKSDDLFDSGLFYGTSDGRAFEFTAMHAARTVCHGCRIRHGLLFEGLFLKTAAAEPVSGFFIAVPKMAGITCDILEQRLKGRNLGQPVLGGTGIHNFDLVFDVFASNADAAPSIPTAMLWQMLDIRCTLQALPYLSLVGGEIFLALLMGRKMFAMPPSRELLDRGKCLEYRRDIMSGLKLATDFCTRGGHSDGVRHPS